MQSRRRQHRAESRAPCGDEGKNARMTNTHNTPRLAEAETSETATCAVSDAVGLSTNSGMLAKE